MHILYYRAILFVSVLLSIACSSNVQGLSCGAPTSVEDISSLLMTHRGATAKEILEVMESCPADPALSRLLYSAYIRQGDCEMALNTHNTNNEILGASLFPLQDREDIFLCFYWNGFYERAAGFYETRIGAGGPAPSLMTREAYAQSLFWAGNQTSAIRVLQEIEQEGYPETADQAESAAYESGILSLAQMHFANGDARAAAAAARRFLVFRPDDVAGNEVLLAAVVKAGGIDEIDPHALYCDIQRIQLEDFVDDPGSVKADLAALRDLLLSAGRSTSCH